MREEVDRYRVVIGNQTCIFEKENDASLLRSPSAGKLLSFIVEDGGHVTKGQAYAEIEVINSTFQFSVFLIFQDTIWSQIFYSVENKFRKDWKSEEIVDKVSCMFSGLPTNGSTNHLSLIQTPGVLLTEEILGTNFDLLWSVLQK